MSTYLRQIDMEVAIAFFGFKKMAYNREGYRFWYLEDPKYHPMYGADIAPVINYSDDLTDAIQFGDYLRQVPHYSSRPADNLELINILLSDGFDISITSKRALLQHNTFSWKFLSTITPDKESYLAAICRAALKYKQMK